MSDITFAEMIEKLENMKKPLVPGVVMHYGTTFGFQEFSIEFWDKFINHYKKRALLIKSELDSPDPFDQFIFYMLEKAY